MNFETAVPPQWAIMVICRINRCIKITLLLFLLVVIGSGPKHYFAGWISPLGPQLNRPACKFLLVVHFPYNHFKTLINVSVNKPRFEISECFGFRLSFIFITFAPEEREEHLLCRARRPAFTLLLLWLSREHSASSSNKLQPIWSLNTTPLLFPVALSHYNPILISTVMFIPREKHWSFSYNINLP